MDGAAATRGQASGTNGRSTRSGAAPNQRARQAALLHSGTSPSGGGFSHGDAWIMIANSAAAGAR